MNLFGKKMNIKDEKLDEFFQNIKNRSFEIKLKTKDKEGNTINTKDCDVIKLSSLNDLFEKHLGHSMKNSIPFTKEHAE